MPLIVPTRRSFLKGTSAFAVCAIGGIGLQPPIPAASWNFNTRSFFDDFNSLSTIDVNNTKAAGFNWYVNNAWPNATFPWSTAPSTQASDLSVSNSILTLSNDRSGFGQTLNTIVTASNGNGYIGTVFNNGMYFEARMKFDPTQGLLADASWPAFWTSAAEFMGQNASHFGEMDVMEAEPVSNGVVHLNTTTVDWNPGASSNNRSNNGGAFATPDANWHTYGRLWVPASQNGGIGLQQTWVDGVHLTACDTQYSASAGASPAFTPTNPVGVGSIIDSQHFPVILGTGPNRTTLIDYVAVWTR